MWNFNLFLVSIDDVFDCFGVGNFELQVMVVEVVFGGIVLMLMYVDIDYFVLVNENMSVEVGDQVLVLVVQCFQFYLCGCGKLWWYGSDEFLIVVLCIVDLLLLEDFVEEICQQMELLLLVLLYMLFMIGKLGVSLCLEYVSSILCLFDYVEDVLYQVVCEGGNVVCIYVVDILLSVYSESIIVCQIVDVIFNGELKLCYQLLVSVCDGYVVGMEVLLWWQLLILGMLVLECFMCIVECLGIIVQIGIWVLEGVLKQVWLWCDQGFDDFMIVVNVFILQLLWLNFFVEVMLLLQVVGVLVYMLMLEINESVLINNVNFVYEMLVNLCNEGISLSLDNFGIGDFSFSVLVCYLVDKLKIDCSFIKSVLVGNCEVVIVCVIIVMGYQLGMIVIVNGVELQVQLGFLCCNDCDVFQGYLFGELMLVDVVGMILCCCYLCLEVFVEMCLDWMLLLLDDEENVLCLLVCLFCCDGYCILVVGNVCDVFDLLVINDVQVILFDQCMSDMSGIEFLGWVKMLYLDMICLVLLGYIDLNMVIDVINRGVIYCFLIKLWNDDELCKYIYQVFCMYEEQCCSNVGLVLVEIGDGGEDWLL